MEEQNNTLNFVRDKARAFKDGEDGKNVSPDTAQEIKSKLELVGIETKMIIGLTEFIQELIPKNRFGGGGNSDASTKFSMGRIVKKETPTGDIDGANKAYTVKNNIQIVLSFIINGQAISDDEYTISNRTITMTTAIPTELSGLSFRVIYI